MRKLWTDEAWEEYLFWQTQDRKTLKRINNIIRDIDREPFSGIGKPEPLKHERQGLLEQAY
jgi:toxin YoeB